ncbi:MAG: peptide chain release factor N(5)-glutamine methyltransferase [Sulfobacillus sp.]|nr:peptide chain release factor N(5)-glutamine methyltransferase [Sulfobacillus sp.]
MMETWQDVWRAGVARLKSAGLEDPISEARRLWEFITEKPYEWWVLRGGAVDEGLCRQFSQVVEQRRQRWPYAYITGEKEFFGLRFSVTPAVLIPRPDTEVLVEAALEHYTGQKWTVVDVGTGSGAIGLAVKQHAPLWHVIGTDISAEALDVARTNGERLALAVDWRQGDLLDPVHEPVEMVIANLPYIAPDEWGDVDPECAYEPRSALVCEPDGLRLIRRLIRESRRHLVSGGWLLLECGYRQADHVVRDMRDEGFQAVAVRQDLAGWDRVVMGRWEGFHG